MAELYNPFSAEDNGDRTRSEPKSRLFALGRFLIFALLFFVLLKLIGSLAGPTGKRLHTLYWSAMFGNLQALAASLFATGIMARLEHRPFGYYGLGKNPCGRRFGSGVVCGFVALTLLLLAMRLTGAYFFGVAEIHGASILKFALIYATLFFMVALSEETIWRGYALVMLSKALGFWPAAILLGVIFGASHWHHAQESYAGLIFAGAYGVVLAYSFKRAGSLWFAIGLHAAWDYAQSFLYGVPDSGVIVPGRWFAPQVHGPSWITGGNAGPEGSLLMILVLAGLIFAIRKLYPSQQCSD